MGVKISFTPLYGIHTDHHALAYLLTIDGFNILLDCGWNSAFDPKYLENLAKVAPSIHVVLLSHPDIAHLGALPYAVANLGLTATIFSTLPVWRMGQMFMYDAFLSLEAQYAFDVFNLDDVDAAFEVSSQSQKSPRYHLLKYQQQFPLDPFPNGKGIVITPHAAGHMLGGAVWDIKKDTENIVYAVNFNHRRERHLNPTTLASFSRPSHLIVGTSGALTHTETKKTGELVNHIKSVVKYNGNVLIPVDTAGRLIELAVQLHDAWGSDRDISQVPLVILHDLSTRTFEFARSMIEWMSDEVVRKFDISRENLFIFKHVKLCQSLKALEMLSSPMVVLASSVSMEMGFARQLFAKWSQDSRSAVILVDRPEPNTLYSKLYHHYKPNTEATGTVQGREYVKPLSLNLVVRRKEYLQGQELEEWREAERVRIAQEQEEARQIDEEVKLAREAEKTEKTEKTSLATGLQETTSIGDGPTDSVMLEKPARPAKCPHELMQYPELYEKHVYAQLQRLGVVPAKPAVQGFAFPETSRPSWDDYGQVLDTTRFMIGEDPGEGAPSHNIDHVHANREDVREEETVKEDIPTKYVQEVLNFIVKCQVYHADNSGLSDGDSLKRLVKEVEPRHVTLVAGTKEETLHLKQYLLSNLYSAKNKLPLKGSRNPADVDSIVVSPLQMETVDITSHSSVLDVKLQDSLVAGLTWSQVGLAGIAFIDAAIHDDIVEKGKLILGSRIDSKVDDDMEIDNSQPFPDVPIVMANLSSGHPTVFVGTIMLNRLKDVLTKTGMKAEFAGGALCIENADTGAVVLLKKVGAQHVVIEGALSEEYLTVRDLLYDELVIPQ